MIRITRLVASLATAGLVVATPVLITAGPAAAVVGSTVTLDPPSETKVVYHQDLSFSGQVTGTDGNSPDGGTVTLEIATAANPTYTPIATDDSSYFYFSDIKAVANASYKVVYSGGTTYSGDVVTASESAPVAIAVERKVKLHTDGLKVIGTISPNYKHKHVKILKRIGKKKTSKYAKIKTDKKGRFVFRAPNRIGFRFIVVIPGSKTFAGTYAPYHVI